MQKCHKAFQQSELSDNLWKSEVISIIETIYFEVKMRLNPSVPQQYKKSKRAQSWSMNSLQNSQVVLLKHSVIVN